MATKNSTKWYSAKNGKVVDGVDVPINAASAEKYLRKKVEANSRTANSNPSLKGIADFANSELNTQRKQLKDARQTARSQVRLKDVNTSTKKKTK